MVAAGNNSINIKPLTENDVTVNTVIVCVTLVLPPKTMKIFCLVDCAVNASYESNYVAVYGLYTRSENQTTDHPTLSA